MALAGSCGSSPSHSWDWLCGRRSGRHRDVRAQGISAPCVWRRWACAALLLGFLELCYAVYLLQLPDWSSLRVVSIVTLGIAAVYAAVAGIRLLAAPGNRLMEFWELDGNVFSSSQEALWCLMLVLLTGSLSYAVGHLCTRWSRRACTAATERSAAGR